MANGLKNKDCAWIYAWYHIKSQKVHALAG